LKPIHLNLAARPYRDYRPLYAVVVVASLLIAFLMLNNIDTYYRYVRETQTTRQEIARLENEIQKERQSTEAATNQIRTIDLETLGQQTRFINAQLAERAFSWSELLERLEVVVPNDVRITSIAPSFSENGMVNLRISCEAKTAEGLVLTIDRFNASPHFTNPFPSTDTSTDEAYRFGLSVDYKPSVPRAAR
jgi:Tfp pilus assembly protein PilN